MRPPPAVPSALAVLLRRQEGAATTAQAIESGLSRQQIACLVRHGWSHPMRGVLVAPNPADPFRTSLRAALLARPEGVICALSAARLYKLGGLSRWEAGELPHIILPAGRTYHSQAGLKLHSGLVDGEQMRRSGFPVTTLARTVQDMAALLPLDELVCPVDSALHVGWAPEPTSRSGQRKLRRALALADKRAESTFETLLRLLLVRAGLPPETLQFEVFRKDGRLYGRVDMAWPSIKLAVEADGREFHDLPDALYGDRDRANDLVLDGWTILRFTWRDLFDHPERIIEKVRRALNELPLAKPTV